MKELKYYTNSRRITSPINTNKQELVQVILGHQAKQLCDLARKAVAQVSEDVMAANRDVLNVDLDRLLPHTSAYSGRTGDSSVDRDTGSAGLTGREQPLGASGGGGGRGREEADSGSSSKRAKKVRVQFL